MNPSKSRVLLGRRGEKLAADFLRGEGFIIIDTNIHIGHSDIDILAEDEGVIVFTEVRTKSSGIHGMPEETFSWKKLSQMRKTAGLYLEINKIRKQSRIDAVCIIIDKTGNASYLKHYRGI